MSIYFSARSLAFRPSPKFAPSFPPLPLRKPWLVDRPPRSFCGPCCPVWWVSHSLGPKSSSLTTTVLLLPHLSPLELRSIQVSAMERGQQAPRRIQACHDRQFHSSPTYDLMRTSNHPPQYTYITTLTLLVLFGAAFTLFKFKEGDSSVLSDTLYLLSDITAGYLILPGGTCESL